MAKCFLMPLKMYEARQSLRQIECFTHFFFSSLYFPAILLLKRLLNSRLHSGKGAKKIFNK